MSNEENNYIQMNDHQIGVDTYINSNIGACIDTGNVLKYLLDKENIDNNLVSYAGHVMNEVRFGDGWYTLDSTSNIMFHARFDYLKKKQDKEITVTIFPHNNLVYKDNPFYRKKTGQIRLSLLLKTISHSMSPKQILINPSYIK